MKRITKIAIALVVMVLVICSVLAVFASAADDTAGITSIGSGNFESGDPTKDYLTGGVYSTQYPTIGGQQFGLNNCGTLTVQTGVNNDGSENQYAFYTPDAYTGTLSSTYSVYAIKNNMTEKTADGMIALMSSSSNDITNNLDGNAFIYDIDVATSENYKNFPYKARFQFTYTYLNASGTYATKAVEVMLSQKILGSSDATITHGGKSYDIDTSKWNHVTVSLYTVRSDSSYDVYVAVWVNDEFAFANQAASGLEYYTVDGTQHVASGILHARFLLNGTASVDDRAGIAIDNTNYRMVDLSANTSYANILSANSDLTDWGGSVYNESTMPKTLPTIEDASMTGIRYYTSSTVNYTTDFKTAMTSAVTNSTITLFEDISYTYDKDVKISLYAKNYVVDLNGHTLTLYQNNQSAIVLYESGGVSPTLTFKNGVLRSTQVNESYLNRSFAVVYSNGGTCNLNLENVDTYVGQLANCMNWSSSKSCLNVNIIGGFHSSTQTGAHVIGGFVESRIEMHFSATDATFFFDSNSWLVTQFYRFKDNLPMESTFDFTRCTIINDPDSVQSLGAIAYANEYAKFTFNDCDIYSEINPTVNPSNDWVYDASTGAYSTTVKNNSTPASNIVFGEGTRFYSGKELSYTYPDDNVVVANSESESYTINDVCDTPSTEYTFTERTFTLTYDMVISEGADYAFQYVSDGATLYTDDLGTALSGADEGTTVTLLKSIDITGYTDGDTSLNELFQIAQLVNSITLDLNDKTLTIYQSEQNAIYVKNTLTVKNGTLRAVVTANNWTMNMTHPLFQFNGSASVLNLENVTTYLSGLAYSYGASNWTVNITGGTHYITNAAQGAYGGGWICARTTATLNAKDATFYTSGKGTIAYATTHNIASDVAGKNTFNFDGCTIVSASDVSFIQHANENTYINFTNNCVIDAVLNPTVYTTDTNKTTGVNWGAMNAGSIFFGNGTTYNSERTMIGDGVIVYEDGYECIENAYKEVITFAPTSATPYTDSFATTSKNYTILTDMTVCDLSDYTVQYQISGKTTYGTDLLLAISEADADSTVALLADYLIESVATQSKDTDQIIYALYKHLTIDLGGNTLTIYQHIQYAFRINRNITFKNGNINVARDGNAVYPIFYITTGGYTLTLDNVNTYGAYIYGMANNATIKVEGGTHIATQSIGGTTGRGWLTAVCSTNLVANNATFFNDSSIGIISSISRKQASGVADSNYTFNNCTFIEDPSDKATVSGTHGSSRVMGQGIIWYANENSYFNFNDCDIHAAVNPQRYWDSATYSDYVGSDTTTYWGAIKPGAIVFGIGTKYDSSYTIVNDGTIVTTEGYAFGSISESKTMTITDGADAPVADGAYDFAFADRELTLNLTMAVVYPSGYKVKYTVGNVDTYGNDFIEALKSADANSTVYLQANYVIQTETENVYTIYKNLNIDLGGNVLSVYQEWQTFIGIGANIKISNGEVRAVRSSDIKTDNNNSAYNNKSFPLFRMSKAGSVLTLENITSYSGELIHNYNASDVTVNIIGGEHHITHHDESGAQGAWGGFIETRGSLTFNAENAVFFADRSGWVITSTSYYDGITSVTEDSVTTITEHAPTGSSFTFTGCTLISDQYDSDGSFTLVKYANEFTKITLNSSLIYGSINPEVYSSDKNRATGESWGEMPAENLVFGEGTRIATSIGGVATTFMGNSFANSNINLIDETYTSALVVKACNDKPYTEGYIFTNTTVKMSFQKVVADTVNITVTFHYPDGTESYVSYEFGALITEFPTYDIPDPLNNGWVKITYDGGWSLEGYGDAISELTVTGRIHLYPSATSAKAYMSSAMYNLSLYGNVGVNLLIPDETNVPDGIILWDVYDTDGNLIVDYRSGVVGAGVSYRSYEIGKASVLSLDTPVVGKVYFTFNNIEFVQTITLNPYSYVAKVMTDADSNPKSVTLLADMVRYATELYQFSKGDASSVPPAFTKEITISGGTTTLADLSSEKVSTLATADSFTGGEMGSFTSSDYISAISFNLGGADPSYVVYFKEGTQVVDVEFIMNDAYLNSLDGYNRGKVVYGINDSLSTYFDGTEYLSSAQSTGISIYNIDNFVEIRLTILSELGSRRTITCTGNYNLNSYYTGIAPTDDITEADIERAREVLLSLRSFGQSTALYRYDDVNAGETVSNKVAVYYEDFGAVADGETDDFGAIYLAHEYANEQKALGRDVTVYAIKPDGVIAEGSTFFIDNTDTEGEYHSMSAVVKTDVNWTGAKFVINDYGIFEGDDSDNPSYDKVTTVTNYAFYTPIFTVKPDQTASATENQYRHIKLAADRKLFTTDTEIAEIAALGLPFDTALLYIQNASHHNYVRYGANATSTVQHEVVLVDTRTGKIDPSTPITHDFTAVSYINIYNASEEAITLEGGSFETLYNRVNTYSYCRRGIEIVRSNVTIKNVTQDYTYSSFNDQVSGGSPMQQIFGTSRTHGVTIDNCVIEGPRRFWDVDNGDGTGTINRGSYTIRADLTSSLTISNIKQTNIYADDDENNKIDHHAVMGSNYCKNVTFENNYMSAFDSHSGFHNLIVSGCTVERLNTIGTGTIIVEDTTIHTANTNSALVLREDYNSNFKGDVYLRNVILETYDAGYVGLFYVGFYNYNTGLYYSDGYQWTSNGATVTDQYHVQDTTKGDGDDSAYYSSYLPQNVYIDGLTVLTGGSVVSDESSEFGGIYTPGSVASASDVTVALYNGYNLGGTYTYDTSKSVLDVHEWDCDISTYGSSFTKDRVAIGSWVIKEGTTYTVTDPIKPTEYVYNDSIYTINDYVFGGDVYNSLAFLDNLTVENAS